MMRPVVQRLSMVMVAALPGVVVAQSAQVGPAVQTTVGVSARTSFVSKHDDLIPLPEAESGVPMSVRILDKKPTAEGTLYQVEYLPFEAGTFNVRLAMGRSSGGPMEDSLPANVRVGGLLTKQDLDVSRLSPTIAVSWPWYRIGMISFVVVWVLVSAWWLFGRRRKTVEPIEPELSLREKVRQVLLEAAKGSDEGLSSPEIERLLLTFWQEELGLSRVHTENVLQELLSHPEANEMIDRLTDWLHRPGAVEKIDAPQLLAILPEESATPVEVKA